MKGKLLAWEEETVFEGRMSYFSEGYDGRTCPCGGAVRGVCGLVKLVLKPLGTAPEAIMRTNNPRSYRASPLDGGSRVPALQG
jgi:hypothetical protein